MRNLIKEFIDIQAKWLANWLRSRSAFVALVYGTVGWIPLVFLGIDRNGFIYLYIATSLSLITQSPLAMLAYWASRDAKKGEEKMKELLQAMLVTMTTIHQLVETVKASMIEQEEHLEEIEGALSEHEQHAQQAFDEAMDQRG